MKKATFPRLVGVLHLSPLPGSPRARGTAGALKAVADTAVREAIALSDAGFEALVVENFGDTPFYKTRVPAETVAAMSVVAAAVRAATRVKLGVNVLRNDGDTALAIAATTGCEFIRVNVLSGVAATDQGLIEGEAAALMRRREAFAARGARVQVWADALVKHARTLSETDVELAVEELAARANADAVIVTGPTTGRAVELSRLEEAARAARACGTPLYLGSGTTAENLGSFAPRLESGALWGAIVGSTLRAGGRAGAPLDRARVKSFTRAWRALGL